MPTRALVSISLVAFVLLPGTAKAAGQQPRMGPILEDYGPVYELDLDVPVAKDVVYRAVFDAASYSADLDELNAELVSVARFLNMHTRLGVPRENMDLVVVLHGEALKSALVPAAYEKRYGVANPSFDLLTKLSEAGVRFYACGQSLGFRDIESAELAEPVQIALSAMTVLTRLQSDGYALLP